MNDTNDPLKISWQSIVKKFEEAFNQAYTNSSASKVHLDTCKVSIEGAGSRWVNVIILDCIVAYAKEGFGLHKSRDKRRFNQFAILDSCVGLACATAIIERQVARAGAVADADLREVFAPTVGEPFPSKCEVTDLPTPWENASDLFQNLMSATSRSSKAKRQKIIAVLQMHVPNDVSLIRLLNFVCGMIYTSHFHSQSFVARSPLPSQSMLSTSLTKLLERDMSETLAALANSSLSSSSSSSSTAGAASSTDVFVAVCDESTESQSAPSNEAIAVSATDNAAEIADAITHKSSVRISAAMTGTRSTRSSAHASSTITDSSTIDANKGPMW